MNAESAQKQKAPARLVVKPIPISENHHERIQKRAYELHALHGHPEVPHSRIGFTRNSDGSINLDDPPIIAEISGLAELMKVRFIAEAWDLATYQLGRSFPGLSWLQ